MAQGLASKVEEAEEVPVLLVRTAMDADRASFLMAF